MTFMTASMVVPMVCQQFSQSLDHSIVGHRLTQKRKRHLWIFNEDKEIEEEM